jgi:DNA repair exonuclease SbcCD ATPase subunit
MIPLKITLSGFMSYREKQTLTFDGARLWVLSGPNGAGKSAIFDAITFVLFGVYRDHKQNFTDLINHGCDKAVVVYDFRLGDVVYRVQRTIPKRGAATRCAYTLISVPDGCDPKLEPIERTDLESGFNDWVEHTIGLNYETFTASVLLQQGKSDRLLDSATDQRYKILSKLIDLSRYEELESRAKDRKRYWDGRVTYYTEQLANLPPVLAKDLADAQQRIKRANAASKAALAQVEELTGLYGYAQRWETLQDQLGEEQADLAKARQLINEETEIVKNYRRWVELAQVLPTLTELLSSRIRLDKAKQAEIKHKQEFENTLEPLRAAEEREEKLRQEYEEQGRIANEHQQEKIRASDRQIELNPVIVLLERIDENRSKRENYLKDLSVFPPDLQQQLADTLDREARFSEAGKAVSWLHNLKENRNKLQKAVGKRDNAIENLGWSQSNLEEAHRAQLKADEENDQASRTESEANSALAKAQAHLEEIKEKDIRFSEVEGEKVCRYCGNELTPEHVEREKKAIQSELVKAKEIVHASEEKQQAATERVQAAKEACNKAGELVTGVESIIRSQELARDTAIQDINGCMLSLSTAYNNLPLSFQSLVAEVLPGDVSEWFATIYPTLDDISQAQNEGGYVASQKVKAEQLRGLIANSEKISAFLLESERALDQDNKELPIGWETARSEYETVQLHKEQADGDYVRSQAELTRIGNEFSVATREAGDLRNKKRDADLALNSDRAKQDEILTTLHNFEEQLTLEWQPIAVSLTSKSLDTYQSECNSLAHCDQLHRDLGVAKQNVETRAKKVVDLQARINEIPETARCKAEKIKLQLTKSQAESQQAETEKLQSEQDHQALTKRKADRDAVEAKKRNAERKKHLYGILAEQMGDQGIQQALINLAETEIVNEANQSLYNLSGGRWTLSLREQGRNKKALDMEVRDVMTGGQDAIPVVLASGSQRFRIAISLALAIGKYIRRESRRIESVIIDEGFGSLDKTGREDTIQELRSLQQHLERIVLVSHQEEFYKTFQTGYTIDIVNGGSQASLLNN